MISFKVHDLIHNLAREVLGSEFNSFEKGIKVLKPKEIRYADLREVSSDSEVKEVLSSMSSLRELGVKCAFPDIFSRFKHLRVLRINITNELFPSSIWKLKHLRVLVVLSDDIQTVPNSLTNLLNLQALVLSCCPKLRELPVDVGRMINLRHIILAEGAPMSHMPMALKNLTSLRTLTVFFVGKEVGCKLNELHGLMYLEGHLVIKNLENVCDAIDCAEVNLKGKNRLDSLKFSWNDRGSDEDVNKVRSVDVLENLQPHSALKVLEIEGYMGHRFASWMLMKPFFTKLVKISLVKCRHVKNLPPFGELPLLGDLLLKDMDALKFVEGRGENGHMEWFPSLNKLKLENLGHLQSFGSKEDSGALTSLPSLVELKIIQCSRLKSMPLLPSLQRLEVNCCSEKLVHSLLMLQKEKAATTGLKYLKIEECSDLISLPVLSSLEELSITNCSSLITLEDEGTQCLADDMGYLTSLTSLKIIWLPNLVSLPQWIHNLTKLQTLHIIYCKGLIDVPDRIWELTSLRYLIIWGCVSLKSLPDGMQQLTSLEDLMIDECYSLTSWPNGLERLVSLKQLLIGCSSNLPYVPEQLQQLTGLVSLGIHSCQTMLALPDWLLNFTLLDEICFKGCKNLQLADWIRKLKLQTLHINHCGELTSRCQKGTGVDWPKIAHIPNIELNDKYVQGVNIHVQGGEP